MIQLIPMTETEYEAFMEISVSDQAQGQALIRNCGTDEADELIRKQLGQILPDGLATANHYFYAIQAQEPEANIGGLWYNVEEKHGERRLFVMDIQIYKKYRRHGYGEQAFKIMEEKAREMGIRTISLHVFEHNQAARAMYKKLGYTGTATKMSKEIR